MKIHCFFIVRDERSGPELLEAWDEYTIEDNPGGWEDACKASLARLQTSIQTHVVVVIEVSDDALNKKLFPDSIPGSIPGGYGPAGSPTREECGCPDCTSRPGCSCCSDCKWYHPKGAITCQKCLKPVASYEEQCSSCGTHRHM